MTEFERQVAIALTATQADDSSGRFYGLPGFLAVKVAPRMAAAIDRVWDNMATGGIDLDAARDFALRSLRGESSRGVP